MKEIGGYFQLDQLIDKPYHEDMIELNSARNALLYLIKAKNIDKIYIPYYLCDSVYNMLNSYKINYKYYRIDKNFLPIFNKDLTSNDYLYVVNYYGQLSEKTIRLIQDKYKNLILDNVQAFFQKPVLNIDTIYSCRKFFGIPDGAYLSTDTFLNEKLEYEKSSHRMKHILGRYEEEASDYYKDFKNNDESFKNEPIKHMSKLSNNILGAIDYKKVIEIRNNNFYYLNSRLKASNVLNLKAPEGPYAYPYYINNGIEIRKKLAEKKIYVPTLWPNVLKETKANSIEYDYVANILPLPCDQRYNSKDMEIITNEIYQYIY